jgi:CelD/BcsL family acetyltransferase involved in cellulose biosynthesis
VHRDWTVGRMMEYLGSREVYPDHLDMISAPEDAGACVQAVAGYLTEHSADWDVLRMSYLTEDSELKTRLSEHWSRPMKCREASVAAYIPVQGGYDAYLAGLSSNERQKIRSRRRKLLEQQGIRYRAFEPDRCEPALGTLFALHERRAQQKEMDSSFRGPVIEGFHRALFRRMPAEWLWLRGLMHGEEIIGVFYGYRFGNRVFYYQLGYNPDWSAQSAGAVLLQETIREAFEHGCSEYNFLQGGESFKSRWAPQQRKLFHCDVFSTTWRARLSSATQRARELAKVGWRRLRPAT